MDATINVYTFKEGLLSKLGHDLKLSLNRWEVMTHQGQVHGRFDTTSLKIEGAVMNGKLDASELSDSDKQKIYGNLADDVLHTKEHPEIRFEGRVTARTAPFAIEGTLYICGEARPFSVTLSAHGDRLQGSAEITPSQWGIKPFRALAGALRVADRIRVEVDVPAGELATAPLNGHALTWKK
jgi:polyisoprenoid-binding protein YceI